MRILLFCFFCFNMPISADEMARVSKQKTVDELQKLHQSILNNKDLLKSDDANETASDDSFSEESDIDFDDKRKRLTMADVFVQNQHLQMSIRKISVKLQKMKGSHRSMEKKYEQIRIENSQNYLSIDELHVVVRKQRNALCAAVFVAIGLICTHLI